MVTRKITFIEQHLLQRAREGVLLSAVEMQQVAAVLRALLPLVEAMEQRPIPPQLRLLQGGLQ